MRAPHSSPQFTKLRRLLLGLPLVLLSTGLLAPRPVGATIVGSEPRADEAAPPEVLALRQQAKGGSAEAMVELGKILAEGRLVPANPAEGERWLRQAHEAKFAGAAHPLALLLLQTSEGGRRVERAAQGLALLRAGSASDPACAIALGQLHLSGQFVAADFDEAERRFREAADRGSAEGWLWLGRLFSGESGFPGRANPAVASQCLEAGFAKGSLEAGRLLVDWLRSGEKIPRDEARAFELVRIAAEERGSAEAQVLLGELYEAGSGTTADPALALDAYTAAAEAGQPEGMTKLGLRLLAGAAGAEPDPESARAWLERAAALDHAPARYRLALLLDGESPPDGTAAAELDRAAVAHLVAAAGGGLPEAQDRLGAWYRDGRHVVKDLLAASGWFQAAASSGHLSAKINLAQILEANRRNAEDLGKAFALYGESAAGGHPVAHYHLARLHRAGAGVPADLARAHAHAAKAVEAGFEGARELLAELEAALGPEQRAQSVSLQEGLTVLPMVP